MPAALGQLFLGPFGCFLYFEPQCGSHTTKLLLPPVAAPCRPGACSAGSMNVVGVGGWSAQGWCAGPRLTGSVLGRLSSRLLQRALFLSIASLGGRLLRLSVSLPLWGE